jgi:hypothetical protein
MPTRITLTIPDHLMERVDNFYRAHGHNQKLSAAAKVRFVIDFGLGEYISKDETEIKHGGKREGSGRKAKA